MNGMAPRDIGLLATIGETRVSPDGQLVAYTLTTVDLDANAYRTRVWLAPVGADQRPRPVTAGEKADTLPRWSPDGRLLAFVSTRSEQPGIYLLAVDGPGEPTLVTSAADEISELAWSPAGDRLAYVARVPDQERYGPPGQKKPEADMPPRRVTRLLSQHNGEGWVFDRRPQVHVVPVDGSAPPQALTALESGATSVTWAPDGERIAYVAATHDTWDIDGFDDLWVLDAAGGEPTRLTDTTKSWANPAWSPDGARIAALADPTPGNGPRNGQLWVLDASSGKGERWAPTLDRTLTPYGASRPPAWLGDSVLAGFEDHGSLHLAAVSGDQHRVVVGGERVIRSWDVAGGTLAYAASTVTEPSELWLADSEGKGERRVTDHSATLAARVALGRPERFVTTSTNGAEVECWAIPPVGAEPGRRYPTILNVHGGPFTQYGYGFFDEFQLQVGAGYGVVYCNPRGSSGYEEAWGRAIRWPEAADDPGSGWGGVDYDDVMACVDEAVKRFSWVDEDRLGVQGGSYGGYMTSWIVGHTDRFKAAVSERAVNNLVTMEANSDISGFFREYVGWTHLQRPDIYARQSPTTYVEAMTTPTLILHSEDDLRCPISQAEELFVSLRLLGRHPELVRFPAENHELSRAGKPLHRVMRAEIILDWFGRHLQATDP